jgi:hypothetical protein
MSVFRLSLWSRVIPLVLLPCLSACAQAATVQSSFPVGQQTVAAGTVHEASMRTPIAFPAPTLTAEEEVLAKELRQGIGSSMAPENPVAASHALAAARTLLARETIQIDHPQTMLVVDRSQAVQRLWIVIAKPGAEPWPVIGSVKVSTGRPGRKEHFKSPVGVFTNTPAILGYRALGTVNENGIRGIGQKGMRVWDFGWQTTEDWRKKGALTAVRLEMHATDPNFLEGRLGRADSEACIRIPARFNTFMDRFGLIDARLTALAPTSRAIAALLPKDATPTPLAGDKVVVVDTSDPEAMPSDPVEAQQIQDRFAQWLAAQPPAPTPVKASPVVGGPVQMSPASAEAHNTL